MKKTLYIFLACVLSLVSCSLEEMNPMGAGQTGYVRFVARPTSFSGYNVSAAQTKAYTETEMTELESKIHTAYFLVFKPNGNLKELRPLAVDQYGVSDTPTIRTDVNKEPVTVCFIANVPYSYVASLDTKEKLLTTPLSFDYEPHSKTGYIGVPKLKLDRDGNKVDDATATPCFPMFGMQEVSLMDAVAEDGTIATIQIPLKRLFAKVQVDLTVDLYDNALSSVYEALGLPTGGLLNTYFNLKELEVHNLPKQVLLGEVPKDTNGDPTSESPWATEDSGDDPNYAFESIQLITYENKNVWDISSQDGAAQPEGSKIFSISFYVPEYALIPTGGTNSDQTKKPTIYNKDTQKPVYMTFTGLLRRYDNTNAESIYSIYFGEDNSDSFSLFRNNLYKNNVVIDASSHLNVNTDNRVERLPLNLVEVYGEAANCYIITVPGDYIIDTYKGAFSEITSSTPKVSGTPIKWDDGNNTITCSTYENDPTKIKVSVNPKSGQTALAEGNAVVSIPNGWSWHLWIVPASDNDQIWNIFLGTLEEQTYQVSNAVMLNRNLGASAPDAAGAYYKWGNNKPYFGGEYKGAGTASSYTWSDGDTDTTNDVKQETDPCPPGYMVPSKSIWISESAWKASTAASLQITSYFSYDINPYIYYPYSSYINSSGTMESTHVINKEYHDSSFSFTATGLTGQDRYSDMTLLITMNTQLGVLWDSNNGCLSYGHASVNWSDLSDAITIVKCKKEYRTRKISWSGITYGEWQDQGYVSGSALSTTDKAQMLLQLVQKSGVISETTYTFKDETGSSSGYQVRCQKIVKNEIN